MREFCPGLKNILLKFVKYPQNNQITIENKNRKITLPLQYCIFYISPKFKNKKIKHSNLIQFPHHFSFNSYNNVRRRSLRHQPHDARLLAS